MRNFDANEPIHVLHEDRPASATPAFERLNHRHALRSRTSSNPQHLMSRRSLLSQRILRVLVDRSQQPIIGDDNRIFTGRECLQAVVDLCQEIVATTPEQGRVIVLFPPSAAQAVAILSVMYSGRVPVVLNHWTSKRELGRIIAHHDIHGLITFASESPDPLLTIPKVELDDELKIKTSTKVALFSKPVAPAEAALILFTSGSTGFAKAVTLSEDSLIYMVDHLIERLNLGPASIATITLPIFHTMALITQFLPTFFAGGHSVIINTEMSTGKLYRLIESTRGTFVALISDMLKYCKDEMEKRQLPLASEVKVVQLAGGHINATHIELARDIFPNATIYKGYGLTEGIRVAMISSDDPHFWRDTAGYPLPGQEISVRDPNGVVLANGECGEIHVKGPNLMLGYDGDIPSPFTSDGFLATGDFGFVTEEGYIVIQGRRDHVFKSNGRKIAAREIEEIAIELPQVLKGKCIPVSCPQKGLRPVLLVEIDKDNVDCESKVWKNALVTLLKERLEAFKVPKDVVVTTLPQLANGKIDHASSTAIWSKRAAFHYLGKATFGCHFHSF